MVPNIQKTADLVEEITASSEEQAQGIGQISDAVSQLDKAAQQNASGSEQLAATAEELSGQALQLQQVMSFFKVDTNQNRVFKAQPGQSGKQAGDKQKLTKTVPQFNSASSSPKTPKPISTGKAVGTKPEFNEHDLNDFDR
jgi:Methyl-accepting chemotaxis protein